MREEWKKERKREGDKERKREREKDEDEKERERPRKTKTCDENVWYIYLRKLTVSKSESADWRGDFM